MQDAVEEATEYILANDAPICDYTIEGLVESAGSKLRNGIRKVMVLNKAKEVRKLRIIELIEFIKAHKKRQAQQAITNMIEGGTGQPHPNSKMSSSNILPIPGPIGGPKTSSSMLLGGSAYGRPSVARPKYSGKNLVHLEEMRALAMENRHHDNGDLSKINVKLDQLLTAFQ